MTDHFQAVVDHVMSDDNSELAKTKAELAYALMSLEREIAIAQSEQARCERLMAALRTISKQVYTDGGPTRAARIAMDALDAVSRSGERDNG